VTDEEGRFQIDVDPEKEKIPLQTAYQVVVVIAKSFSTPKSIPAAGVSRVQYFAAGTKWNYRHRQGPCLHPEWLDHH
jgi:hypothetical protein